MVTCVTFVWFSAPDLAVTQLLVEIVTTVLLLLGLRWLPKRLELIARDVEFPARLRRAADLVVAVACGAGIAAIAHAVMTRPLRSETAAYFLENAYSEGGGTNVVNVILVDFRAFDTFGEITVLGIVGLTVFALLRRFRPARESMEPPEQQRIQSDSDAGSGRERGDTVQDYLRVPSVVMQWMFPAIIMLAAYLFLRGHDLPGGGFAAGVALAIGFLLQYLAANVRWVEDRLRILPVRWMGAGLLIAAATGAGRAALRLSVPDRERPLRDAAGDRRRAARHRAPLRPRGLRARRRRHHRRADRARPPVAARRPRRGRRRRRPRRTRRARPRRRRGADGARALPRDRGAGRLRGLAAAAAAHLPGDLRPGAALLRGEPLHLLDGAAAGRGLRHRHQGRRGRPGRPTSTRCRRRWC